MTYHFPKDFIIGTATASYQVEGSREKLQDCIWDDFAKNSGKVYQNQNGLVAVDSINKIDEDIELLKELHVHAYRFSISWTRIIKDGTGDIIPEGIQYYKTLVRKLRENCIAPFVTIYHWDLPSCLQEKGGWENDEIVSWFTYYCKVIFENLGHDVPYFVTVNEPYCVAHLGYGYGVHAPGLTSLKAQVKASINLLKAHGAAVQLYKEMKLPGKIGIDVNINDIRPVDETANQKVKEVKNQGLWWYFFPIATGAFPSDAVAYYKSLKVMPELSKEDMALITTKGDFIGLNHYNPETIDKDGNKVETNLPKNDLGWDIDPKGFYNVLKEMSLYTDMDIYVLENGYGSDYKEIDEIHDKKRVSYYKDYLEALNQAMDEGVKVKAYFAWSLLDNYEWAYGYSKRFGVVHVDYENNLKRTIKDSGYFIRDVADSIGKKRLVFEDTFDGTKLDENKWNVIHHGYPANAEEQFYVNNNKNIIVNNSLNLVGLKEDYEHKHYTSGKITSKQAFKYGHFEAVCKVPKGNGSWPAIWMMPLDKSKGWPWCGEIDFVETTGRFNEVMHCSLHTGLYNHTAKLYRTAYLLVLGASDTYHTYTLDWTKDYISYAIDGCPVVKFEKDDPRYEKGEGSWPFDKEFYLIINLAVGGHWAGPINNDCFPMVFDIKSIKVYEWEE